MRHFAVLRPKSAARRMRETDFTYVDTLVKRWSPAWDVPAGETDAVKEAFREPGSLEAALGDYRAVGFTLPASHRKRITVPAESLAGTDDMIAPEVYDKAASWFTAGYRVVKMPGGHFMHREHPDRFNQELIEALGGR